MQLMATLRPGQQWRLASPTLDHPSPEWKGQRPPRRLVITEIQRRSDAVLAQGWNGPIDPEMFCRGHFILDKDSEEGAPVTLYRRLPALSIMQPMAWAIMMGHCPVINMDYEAPRKLWGQYMWVHSSLDFDGGAIDEIIKMGAPGVPRLAKEYMRGAILGAVCVAKSVNGINSPWFRGPHGWMVEKPVRLDTLVPCRACEGLWVARPHVDMEV